ncbi:hypothetical protein [Euzebya sp.]|uniref:hypothetical protein n=1 Tax=Euzebya sp. TaxID=1971409 RepID=UPI003518646A
MRTATALNVVHRDGTVMPVAAAGHPDELKAARKALVMRARAAGVPLVDRRAAG